MNRQHEIQEIDQLCRQITNPFTETIVWFNAAAAVTMAIGTGIEVYGAYQFREEVLQAEEALGATETGSIEIDGHVFDLPDTGSLNNYLQETAPKAQADKLEASAYYLGITLCSTAITGICIYVRRGQLDPSFKPFDF